MLLDGEALRVVSEPGDDPAGKDLLLEVLGNTVLGHAGEGHLLLSLLTGLRAAKLGALGHGATGETELAAALTDLVGVLGALASKALQGLGNLKRGARKLKFCD